MQIEYVTHSSLLLRARAWSMLLDPFYLFRDDVQDDVLNFPARTLRPSDLGRLDFVFSSHIHDDHCHEHTLEALKEQIGQVFLPAEHPELTARYRKLGFERITFLENGVAHRITDGLEVTCHWNDPVNTILVVRAANRVLLHQNDCVLSLDRLKQIAAQDPIDYAFIRYTGSQNLFPLALERSEEELRALVRQREDRVFAYSCNVIDVLQPKAVIPYGMTMAWFNPDQVHLNGFGRLTPVTYAQRLKQVRPLVRCWALQPGAVIDTDSDTVISSPAENHWGQDDDEYVRHLRRHIEQVRHGLRFFDPGSAADVDELACRYFTERVHHPFVPALKDKRVHISVQGRDDQRFYALDLREKSFISGVPPDASSPADLSIFLPASLLKLQIERDPPLLHQMYTFRIRGSLRTPSGLDPMDDTMFMVHLISSVLSRTPHPLTRVASTRVMSGEDV